MLCHYSTVITRCQLLFRRLLHNSSISSLGAENCGPGLGSVARVKLVLALDAGTTGVRTVAFGPRLEAVFESYRELTQYFPSPGEVEHDPLEIARLAISTLREVAICALDEGHEITAIGITNQRETTVGFDRETGIPFGRAIVWQDRRTADRCQQLEAEGYGPQVRATTGLVLDSYFSATKMRWMLDHGVADSSRQPSFSTVDTWLLWTLTGGIDGGVFATEPSNASRTMLMDLATLDWSEPMMTLFGIERSTLADIQASASRFGAVSRNAIAELAGVPITGMLGDQQSALFGQACFSPGAREGDLRNRRVRPRERGRKCAQRRRRTCNDRRLGPRRHGPVSYALEGSAFVAGAAVQWLRDLGIIAASSELEALALSVPDSAGAQFVPAFTGSARHSGGPMRAGRSQD